MQDNKDFSEWLDSFLDEMLPVWTEDPVQFCQDVLFFSPDEWQKEALYALRDNPRVAVKSGQGVGKTGVEACALIWFLVCFPDARIVATAPTKQQLNDVLWSEVAKWMNNSDLLRMLMKWTKTYIYMIGYEKRWFAVARTATKPENMQGFHEENMLFIIDEASGVADPIMEAIYGTLSGVNNKLLMMGNPTKVTGAFHDAFTADRSLWKCFTVSSRNSPRTNKDNIASLDRKYGKKSNVVRVRVDGEFPEQDDDIFIPISYVEQSIDTDICDDTLRGIGEYVAKKLNMDKVYTELLPDGKVEKVEELLKQKSENGKLVFVGDGINDAPVLTISDIGVAMGGLGSDAAIEAADIVIMTDETSKISKAINLSKKTMRIVRENIIFAIFVKIAVLVLTAFGASTMWEAVFADVGVSVIAIINALRMLNIKKFE